jgi:hypothetical protein
MHKYLIIAVAACALAAGNLKADSMNKYYRYKFRAKGVQGEIITEIRAESVTQVQQILKNQYQGAYNFEIVGPFYR